MTGRDKRDDRAVLPCVDGQHVRPHRVNAGPGHAHRRCNPGEVDLFFSRAIGIGADNNAIPIIGGGRLSGRIAENTSIGIINMQTQEARGLAANNFTDCYIRAVVTRGVGDLGSDPKKSRKPSLFIIADYFMAGVWLPHLKPVRMTLGSMAVAYGYIVVVHYLLPFLLWFTFSFREIEKVLRGELSQRS